MRISQMHRQDTYNYNVSFGSGQGKTLETACKESLSTLKNLGLQANPDTTDFKKLSAPLKVIKEHLTTYESNFDNGILHEIDEVDTKILDTIAYSISAFANKLKNNGYGIWGQIFVGPGHIDDIRKTITNIRSKPLEILYK